MCCNSLLVACVSVFIKCSIMPKSYLCTHVCSRAFPCLFSGRFMVCAFVLKRTACKCVYERERERGGTCACVRSPQPHRGSPHPCQGPVPSHPSLKWQQRTQTGPHRHTHIEQDAELSWGQSQQMSWSELACCVF